MWACTIAARPVLDMTQRMGHVRIASNRFSSGTQSRKVSETMIAVATMESNNPLVILAAMLWNALYSLGAFIWSVSTTTTKMVMSVVAMLWRPVGLFLLLAATVALVALFALVTKRGC